jgi:hypothetical protein
MKLRIEVDPGEWQEVCVKIDHETDDVVEFVGDDFVVDEESIELNVLRFNKADSTVDLFSFEIGGLDTVKAEVVEP